MKYKQLTKILDTITQEPQNMDINNSKDIKFIYNGKEIEVDKFIVTPNCEFRIEFKTCKVKKFIFQNWF